MGYRNKKEVLKTIAQRERRGKPFYDAYIGYDPITKRQRRVQGVDLQKVKEEIEEFYAGLKACGSVGVVLKTYQVLDAKVAYDTLEKHNIPITLEQLTRQYVEAHMGPADKGVGVAYDEYFASFPIEQTAHRSSIRSRVGKWVESFGRQHTLGDVTAKQIVDWLSANCNAPKTYNNNLTYIRAFLNWCTKAQRNYLKENPLKDVELKPIAYKEPEYLKAEDALKLFRLLESMKESHPDWLVHATLSFFCGIRREEILRMAEFPDAANVNLEDETIRISKPKGWTKGIAPRAFRIPANALAWLKSADFGASVKRIHAHTIDFIYKMAKENGITIPHNAGRHTFITMHVAAYGDPSKTEAMVGTSKKMRVSNYCGLASHKDGEAYFAIMPS